MSKLFIGIALTLIIGFSTVEAEPSIAPEGQNLPIVTRNDINEIITRKAFVYDISEEKLRYIIEKESQYDPKAIGDMDILCPTGINKGKPVRARGIIQITECYYPEITDECAFDVECSIDKMAILLKNDKTCYSQWTTCRNYLKNT